MDFNRKKFQTEFQVDDLGGTLKKSAKAKLNLRLRPWSEVPMVNFNSSVSTFSSPITYNETSLLKMIQSDACYCIASAAYQFTIVHQAEK